VCGSHIDADFLNWGREESMGKNLQTKL